MLPMRTFKIKLFICMLILQQRAVDCSSSQTFNFNTDTAGFDDLVCSDTDVLDNTTTYSDVMCAHVCAARSACRGFFYHHDDEICVTTRNYFLQAEGLLHHEGMKYYRGPLWASWSSWSVCSETCGTGSLTRTRTCHQDSPFPCVGPTQETKECNTFACFPLGRTCADWANRGLNQSASVSIDPLENGLVSTVECDFDMEPGRAVTIVRQNKEDRTLVTGYEARGSYGIYLSYAVGMEKATAIVNVSTSCKQYLSWECLGALISMHVYWRNRNGDDPLYFTGSPPPGKMCLCGDLGLCSGGLPCNCDVNDGVWRSDAGYVTNKSDLPIKWFGGGDTGSASEQAYHTIGPLLCY